MAQVTVEISEEAKAVLEARAQAQGCSLEALVKEAVEEAAGVGDSSVDPTLVADIHRLAAGLPPIELRQDMAEKSGDDPFGHLHELVTEEDLIGECPTDLAMEHDHYIYGSPEH